MGHGDGAPVARPRAAEWARMAVHRAGYLLATTPGGVSVWTPLHAVDPTGAVVLVVPATDPLVAAVRKAAPGPGRWPGPGLIAMAEAREESPIPLPCPTRARVRLEGRLRELAADEARSGALEIALRRPADELLDLGAGHTALELQVERVELVASHWRTWSRSTSRPWPCSAGSSSRSSAAAPAGWPRPASTATGWSCGRRRPRAGSGPGCRSTSR